MHLGYAMLMMKPTSAQQADLEQLLRDQQNPSSPSFRQWLSPEQFADRFGLSVSDQSKVVAWLTAQGLTVNESARARNWIAFSGSVAQITKTFQTAIHRYNVNGEMHFSNTGDPSVPSAIADVVGGMRGLDDFRPKPQAHITGTPDFTSGKNHYLAPGDIATIYDIAPLITAGFDGTGQNIAVIGQSDIQVSDITSFRSDFGLPVNNPKTLLFGSDPGFNGAQIESNLDLEWSGAVAPKATITYVYATDAFNAMIDAVAQNMAPVISSSFAICESDSSPILRSVAQQANAQGITIVAAAGDAGGGGCDIQGDLPVATHGPGIQFPSNLPEVTGMGGTMFNEGSGTYWGTKNSSTGGSALSYIPEVVWNENSVDGGLGAGGGGGSSSIPKPDWQTGPGVPADGMRDTPDLALSSAAAHDPYLITYQGNNLFGVGGTSAAAPSMAGVFAILNQYVVKQGIQKTPGLGNVNPQLYRMAQSAPAAFHDITSGNDNVPCLQGSPGCVNGSYGFSAGAGYDQATGIGSIDANVLVTSWNTAVNPVSVTLSSSASKVTVNDTVTVTATVSAGRGQGTPTGTVSFVVLQQALGSATLTTVNGLQTASVTIPAWQLGVGSSTVSAAYAGNAAFSGGGGSIKIQTTLPTTPGVAAVSVSVPGPVFEFQTGTQAPTWQAAIALSELAGVPAVLTGFTIDGIAQPLSQTFPSPDIPARGNLTGTVVFHNLAVPAIKTFGFTGTDVSGQSWSRQVQTQFRGLVNEQQVNFNLWATPLTMQQNTAAPANCQWSQQITLDEITGYQLHVVGLLKGSEDISSTIPSLFGTTRLAPWGSIQGTLCWSGVSAPATDLVEVLLLDDFGDQIFQEVSVSFAGPSNSAAALSTTPASVSLKPSTVPIFQGSTTLSVNLTDKTQPWTAMVFPANRTTSWLQLSQYAGTGPASLTLTANGTGFEPGVYRASIVIQSPNTLPQWIAVPVMFVNSPTPGGPSVTSVSNAISFTPGVSPGTIVAVYGSQLSGVTQAAATLPLGFSISGTTATVNGWPAPLFYVSPTQLNIQLPYEVGAGPAVLGVNNNGQIGGFQFAISPASPGIFSVNGSIYPNSTAKQGAYATLYATGTGEISQAFASGVPVPAGTPVSALPLPLLPLNVTVGGTPALIQFAGMTPGIVGLTQVNFVVPPTTPAGVQPVVVTSGGIASAPANLTVTAP